MTNKYAKQERKRLADASAWAMELRERREVVRKQMEGGCRMTGCYHPDGPRCRVCGGTVKKGELYAWQFQEKKEGANSPLSDLLFAIPAPCSKEHVSDGGYLSKEDEKHIHEAWKRKLDAARVDAAIWRSRAQRAIATMRKANRRAMGKGWGMEVKSLLAQFIKEVEEEQQEVTGKKGSR